MCIKWLIDRIIDVIIIYNIMKIIIIHQIMKSMIKFLTKVRDYEQKYI